MSATAFIEARDFLLAHHEEYERAYRDFRWPVLDRFNWALDYFDPMAQGNDRPGLWIVDEGGGAGEPLNPEIIERVRAARGLTIRDGYGQTETTLQIGNFPGQPVKPGAMGRPAPGYRIKLLDADGAEQQEAEICLALDPPQVGLVQDYQGDNGVMQPLAGKAYRTGDVALRDTDGYFTYVGRADDVFKASDYRISPFELESALIENPAVAEAAVVPSPDPLHLAIPKAFISLAGNHPPDRDTALSIFRHLRAHLAPY